MTTLNDTSPPKLTIEEAATQFARQAGWLDFPLIDRCPYSADKSAGLYASYWQGWRGAMRRRSGRVRRDAA